MATANETDKTPAELEKRVWRLIEKLRFCMYSTWAPENAPQGLRSAGGASKSEEAMRAAPEWRGEGRIHQRPLTANGKEDEGAIYFLVDAEGSKNWETDRFPQVALSFADPGKNEYLTIAGKADISNDRAKIKEIWSVFAKAWWDDENDPAIRLLTVWPEEAEIWEGPNKLVAGAIMLAAAATGKRPAVGDHGAVRM